MISTFHTERRNLQEHQISSLKSKELEFSVLLMMQLDFYNDL